jgi:hypothetical protein
MGARLKMQGDLPCPCAPTMILDYTQHLVELIPNVVAPFLGLNLDHHTVLSPIVELFRRG